MKQVTGLGTDGASVMTGKKEGLTGHMLRANPHITNTHCSAHRVALCTQQAAENIPAMKHYQQIMESVFYYFKKSPKRCDSIEAVQKLLDEPTLKYIEVHQVRWLSFYKAMETVYRTLDSLLTFFSTQVNDSKAVGLKKKIGDEFFIRMTYALMDILQPVMKLNLFFQKRDLDIALVQVEVNACIAELENMKDDTVDSDKPTFSKELEKIFIDGQFKGHVIPQSKFSFPSTRMKFIQLLIDNITARFPDKQLMTSFGVLGLRPVTFLTEDELNTWGDESIEVLCEHFGHEKVHSYKVDGEEFVSRSEAVIDPELTKQEWIKVKQTVKVHQYPRPSTSMIWDLLTQYHKEEFPNITKLAALALAHPVHTSDCERAFSAQNSVVTPIRNRLSGDHCEQVMRIMLAGSRIEDFDFNEAFFVWKKAKSRKIFGKK